jgi:hypothetical protein
MQMQGGLQPFWAQRAQPHTTFKSNGPWCLACLQVDFAVTLPVKDSAEAAVLGQTVVSTLLGYLGTEQQAKDLVTADPTDPLISVTLSTNSVTSPVTQLVSVSPGL